MPKFSLKITIAVIAMVLIAGASFMIYCNVGAVSNELNALKLIPQPERFTELYFDQYELLPTASGDDQPITFSFVIHNLEGEQAAYNYTVSFEPENGPSELLRSEIATLDDQASRRIMISQLMDPQQVPGKVVVALAGKTQLISFLLNQNEK
jgi:hypothetical protein